jgi:hypothetical protein
MKRKRKILILTTFLIAISVFMFTGCVQRGEEEVVEEKQEEKTEQKVEEKSGDASKFSREDQFLGSSTVGNYEILSLEEESRDDFHRFVFELVGGSDVPNVSVSYRSELGILRVLFKNIVLDSSGLASQRAIDIDEDGIVRIFHNVSPNEGEEIYDIGVEKSPEFSLYANQLDEKKWEVIVDVRYPGKADIEVDRGSDEFGQDDQEMDGAVSSDGARITSYSYGVEENIFRFIWTVRGSEAKPIPKALARYNTEDELVVSFPDLDSDYLARDASETELFGGVDKVIWSRAGKESIYRFQFDGRKNFRLTSSLSPNQVILEIEL